jgi:hypothetical protein
MRTRDEMIEYIQGRLERASDLEIEQYYWFFVTEDDE